MTTASSLGPPRARFFFAAALFAFAPGAASAQTVRVVPVLSLMAGPAGAPAYLPPAAGPLASLSPVPSLITLTPTALPVPSAPEVRIAAPLALAAPAPQRAFDGLRDIDRRMRNAPAPAQAGEWRIFFDGGLQAARGASIPAGPSAAVRARRLAPSSPPAEARPAQPTLGLSVEPSPAPESPSDWKKKIGSHAFWLAIAAIVPGGFLILGAFGLYKLLAAYLRRRRGSAV